MFKYQRITSIEQAYALPDGTPLQLKIRRKPWKDTSIIDHDTYVNYVGSQVLLDKTDAIRGRASGPYGNNALVGWSFQGKDRVFVRTPRKRG